MQPAFFVLRYLKRNQAAHLAASTGAGCRQTLPYQDAVMMVT